MPSPVIFTEEVGQQGLVRRQQCFQGQDLEPLSYVFVTTSTGANQIAATLLADKEFFISKIFMSVSNDSSAQATSLVWSKTTSNANIYSGVTVPPVTSILAAVQTNQTDVVVSSFFDFGDYGFFVAKGTSLFLLLSNSVLGETHRISTTLYTTPTFL